MIRERKNIIALLSFEVEFVIMYNLMHKIKFFKLKSFDVLV